MLQVPLNDMHSHASVSTLAQEDAKKADRVVMMRRLLVAALNVSTFLILGGLMAIVLSHGGWTVLKGCMFAAYLITLPWLSIGFWNAIIGTALLARQPAEDDPLALRDNPLSPITTRTAIAMAVRNEAPELAIGRLKGMSEDIVSRGLSAHFDFHVLSDTDDPDIAEREEALVAAWQESSAMGGQIHYRRRTDNRGYKAGNLEEFCDDNVDRYDYFLPLDADSFLSANAVAKLVRIMQDRPDLGILQTLVVGTPAKSFFTRVFQFGMRHGMRAYTTGSAWWLGDCGPYWGHNALIRMKAFHDHCRLPVLKGNGPLSGHIMSHDQVEAVLMRRAGYHVRVLAEEGESWEDNPPTLPDFIRRELRWCQGNMQYFKLLGMPGLKAMSRLQLVLAILMYLAPAAWMAFVALGSATLFFPAASADAGPYPVALGMGLFVTILVMSLAPKIMGYVGTIASQRQSARYGGRVRLMAGAVVELLFSILMAPVVAFAIAIFALGLVFGVKLDWRAQPRGERRVAWDEALVSFAPQTVMGLALGGAIAFTAPSILPWAAPMLLGFVLAIPFAVVTATEVAGRMSVKLRLFDVPEDRRAPLVLRRLHARLAMA
ncbi:MAG: glucans biosynthesis glucosyltransferase MdoH [Pseudomonadota bacterium]